MGSGDGNGIPMGGSGRCPAATAQALALAICEIEAGLRSASQLERICHPSLWDRAAGRIQSDLPLGEVVAQLWGQDIVDGPVLLHSHGSRAWRRFGVGGARVEAVSGFPSVYDVGLPALRRGFLITPDGAEAARVEACFALIAAIETPIFCIAAAWPDFALRDARLGTFWTKAG